MAVTILRAALLGAILGAPPCAARDMTGLSAQLTPEQSEWVRRLHDRNGVSCCNTADGYDPDWDMIAGRYWVRIEGEWYVVPDAAVLDQPNRIGVPRVWYGRDASGAPHIRCFLPGEGM